MARTRARGKGQPDRYAIPSAARRGRLAWRDVEHDAETSCPLGVVRIVVRNSAWRFRAGAAAVERGTDSFAS